MSDRAALAEPPASPLTGSLRVTSEWRRPLLEPLLRQLREEKCGHVWQPALAAMPTSESFHVFEREVTDGRPTTVFTYYLSRDGCDDPVAVATISPRVAKDSPEDGIPVLGRVYVRPEYRDQSVYGLVLRHRLDLCQRRWGQRLLGVHIGTSSPRVETVFRASFPGRTIHLGDEDLGDAGVVTALIGLTAQFDRQTALPVPERLASEHRLLCEYLAEGSNAMPVAEALPALRALAGYQDAYGLLSRFLEAMPDLR
jgi:hypothetical protein